MVLSLEALLRITGAIDIHFRRGWGYGTACCGDFRPNQEILGIFEPEHPYFVKTNNLGLRNSYDISQQKPADTFRILAIGDSFTFGPYVANNETWPARLEEFLRQNHPDKKIEVLNAGIASYTISDELAYIKEKGFKLQPDMVLLEVTPNDLSDLRQIQRGYFARPVNAETLYVHLKWAIRDFMYDHSYLLNWLIQLQQKGLIAKVTGKRSVQNDEQIVNDIIYGTNHDFDALYEQNFKELADFLQVKHIKLGVFVFPDSTEVEKFKAGDSDSAFKIDNFVKSLAEKYNAQFIELKNAFMNGNTNALYLLPWNGHPSAYGYYIAAAAVAASLEKTF